MKLLTMFTFFAALAAVALGPPSAADDDNTRAGEYIQRQLLSSGAIRASSAQYQLKGAAGQVLTGAVASSEYSVGQGFYGSAGSAGCCILRGDVDDNTRINVSDLTYLVNYLFKGGPPPICEEHGDVDANTRINVSDLTYLVNYLFKGGPSPQPC